MIETRFEEAFSRKTRILIVTPDKLNFMLGLMKGKTIPLEFFRRLAFVVLDEVHSYGGAFGAHFAMLLGRVRNFLASCPGRTIEKLQMIMLSATIRNPEQVFQKFVGNEASFVEVSESGAEKFARTFVVTRAYEVDEKVTRKHLFFCFVFFCCSLIMVFQAWEDKITCCWDLDSGLVRLEEASVC